MKDLTRFVGSRSGRLPTVGDVPPYGIIGVSPSKYLERDPDPPYLRRDIDERLDDALVEQRFLVVGLASGRRVWCDLPLDVAGVGGGPGG